MRQILNSKTYTDFPNIEVEYYKPVELFIDSFEGLDLERDSFKILYVKEAEAISKFKERAIKNSNFFDAIITYEEEILEKCKNSYFLPFGTSWVHNYEFKEKKFQISHLTGHKSITEGHVMRQKIHYKQNKIKSPIDFYISKYGGVENFANNKILGDKKEPLFDSKFHICIENSKQKNYFTEKIVDCFVTKTIPIYWDCPNIGDFFDLNGIITVNSVEEIISVCNNINEDMYGKMLNNIEKNFTNSKKFINIVQQVDFTIKEILKKNK
jgi:hypothetical protein